MKNSVKLFFFACMLLLQTSCISKKKYYLLQGNYNMQNASANYEPIIQKDDRIYIEVMTYQRELSEPFNFNSANSGGISGGGNNILLGYLVDSEGFIDFPVLGKIAVAGFTIDQLRLYLADKLKTYLVDPKINIRILNFKVTVLGAINKPGIVSFTTNRVTLLDALAEAGDLTPYGLREKIMIIRDYQGIKSFHKVDITKADFVNSPYYYLDQNDLIYIQERKTKVDASALPNLPLIVSLLSFITTVTLLLTR